MKENTTELLKELNNLFLNKGNFERQIAFKGFSIDDYEKDLIKRLKKDIILNDEQIKHIDFIFGVKYFDKIFIKKLLKVENLVSSKLDDVLDNKLKLNYLLENNQKLHSLYQNILNVVKCYPNNLKHSTDFINNSILSVILPITNNSTSSTSGEILNELTEIASSIIKNENSKLSTLFNIPANETYFSTAYNAALLVAEVGKRILINHGNLLSEKHTIAATEFPFVKMFEDKEVEDKSKNKADYKKLTLLDIWKPHIDEAERKKHYESILAKLLTKQEKIDSAIVFKNGENLIWSNIPRKNIKYIRGFLNVCMTNNWITRGYTPSQLEQIFKNTFEVSIGLNEKTFRNIYGDSHDKEFTDYLK